jgi:hypothetical protein
LPAERVPRLGGWRRLVLPGLVAAALCLATPAAAAPVSYFPVPGTVDQPIGNLTATPAGGLWATQQLAWGPFNEERKMRLLHFDSAGNLVTASPEQVGDPVFTELAAAADGGIWVLASRSLRHISPSGTVTEVELPQAFSPYDLVAGDDGRAWLRICHSVFEPRSEECEVMAATDSGETEAFPAPPFDLEWPSGVDSMTSTSWSFPVEGGVWIIAAHHFQGEGEWSTRTVFVSSSGQVEAVEMPPSTYAVEAASGSAAWWIQEHGAGGATIGQVDTSGIFSNTQSLANVSAYDPPDYYNTASGRDGDLIWAQNATWSDVVDGQLGVRRVDGTSNVFPVPLNASAVLIDSDANFWSGSCTLGTKLYQAIDGSIWTLSFGHPTRITRQQPSGEFSVFLLGDQASRETELEFFYGIGGLVETDPQALWFSRNTAAGPQLARLNPLDPPPPEVRYPGPWRTTEVTLTTRQRVMRLLGLLLGQSERALQRLWLDAGGRARNPSPGSSERPRPISLQERTGVFSVRGRFPIAGRVTIRLERPGRHSSLLAFGTGQGGPGQRTLVVRLTPSGRRQMHGHGQNRRLVLKAAFDAEQGGSWRKSARLRLR